jgi:Fur family transcriptional regulator, zinc uptake regulator
LRSRLATSSVELAMTKLRPSDRPAAQSDIAGTRCVGRGVRLTGLRQGLLHILVRTDRPLTAYELIPLLEAQLRRKLAPPSVYRPLAFLLSQRLVTRIESRNAYVACANPTNAHACIFFVCSMCGKAEEIENAAIEDLIAERAGSQGFHVTKKVLELKGTCARCASPRGHDHQPPAY